jgi:energy-coupling factor transporter ATP-binding protein EcfA2
MHGQIPGYDEKAALQTAKWKRETELSHNGCVLRVLNGKHSLVIGHTGSGKTFWMAHVAHLYFKRFIFVNPQLEGAVDKITSVAYDEPDELLEGVLDGQKAIQFIPDEITDIALGQLEVIRRGLFDIGAEMNIEAGTWWINFILDEAQEYAWKGSREDVDNYFRRGRRFGVRSFALTQRPQNLSSTIINNIEYQVIFRTGSYESQYFKSYKIPIEEHSTWLKQDYHYCLFDGFEMQECDPVNPTEAALWKKEVK